MRATNSDCAVSGPAQMSVSFDSGNSAVLDIDHKNFEDIMKEFRVALRCMEVEKWMKLPLSWAAEAPESSCVGGLQWNFGPHMQSHY